MSAGPSGLERLVSRAGLHRAKGPVVLLYHRISDDPADPFRLNVSRAHFAEHLEVIRRRAVAASLDTLVRDGLRSPQRIPSIAVTFDDGYADNLYAAKPLLERAEIPATVFAVTGGMGHEFWWDTLARIVFSPAKLPESLEIRLDDVRFDWPPPWMSLAHLRTMRNRFASSADQDRLNRKALLRALHRLIQKRPEARRLEVLSALSSWSKEPLAHNDGYRSATPAELLDLVQGSTIALGAHSVSHPVLASLSPEECRREIMQSRQAIEDITGKSVSAFAYPYGQMGDYSPTVIDTVREAGFEYACAAYSGVVADESDRFHLPRIWVENWDGDQFARRLERWLPPLGS